jgi:hypothetical protein
MRSDYVRMTREDLRAELLHRDTSDVVVPDPAVREISLFQLGLRLACLYVVLYCVAMIAGAHPVGAFAVSMIVTFFALATYILQTSVDTVKISRKRHDALAYFNDVDDDVLVDIVDRLKADAAEKHQAAVEAAWDAYVHHAVSPIATLDPASWEARRKELAKELTDLGERPDGKRDGTRRIARDGDEVVPGPIETWAINRKRRKS